MNRISVASVAVLAAMTLAACSSSSSGTPAASTSLAATLAAPTPAATVTVAPTDTANPFASASSAPSSAPPATITISPLASPSSPATLSVPSDFVGTWYGHSRSLVIKSDGSVTMSYRVYVDCTATRTTGCDRIRGNNIYDGGNVTAHVTQVVDPTTMIIDVSKTTVPSDVPYGPVRVGLDTAHDAVATFSGGFSGVAFCGSHAPDGYCGA